MALNTKLRTDRIIKKITDIKNKKLYLIPIIFFMIFQTSCGSSEKLPDKKFPSNLPNNPLSTTSKKDDISYTLMLPYSRYRMAKIYTARLIIKNISQKRARVTDYNNFIIVNSNNKTVFDWLKDPIGGGFGYGSGEPSLPANFILLEPLQEKIKKLKFRILDSGFFYVKAYTKSDPWMETKKLKIKVFAK